jgi:hypothetical protein
LHGWLPSLAYSTLHCILPAVRATGYDDEEWPPLQQLATEIFHEIGRRGELSRRLPDEL